MLLVNSVCVELSFHSDSDSGAAVAATFARCCIAGHAVRYADTVRGEASGNSSSSSGSREKREEIISFQ